MEPTFDVKFAELQAKIVAVLDMLIAEYPAAAVRAREIIATAADTAEVQAQFAADEARANALAQLITGAGQLLAAVEGTAPETEGGS
jgi:hypothetical protein